MVYEGDLINSQYEILQKISKGTFGEIYVGRDIYTNEKYAIKIQCDNLDAGLKWEGAILKQLNGGIHTPNFLSMGQINEQQDYIVMELLEDDMSTYRHKLRQNIYKYGYLYQLPISIHLTLQMIDCVEYVHQKGFVHRDIKPANFVKRKGANHTYCIVDFGIVKQHVDKDTIRPERFNAEFRGTTMYASVNAHDDKDQSYRDDLWGVIFSFVDILLSQLPWSEEGKKKEKQLVKDLKRSYTNDLTEEKFTNWILEQILSTEAERVSTTQPIKLKAEDMSWSFFNDILRHLNSLSYSDTPDYNLIRHSLKQILQPQNGQQSIFPPLETIFLEEQFIDSSSPHHSQSTTHTPSPDWMFTNITKLKSTTVQDILTLRSEHLLSNIQLLVSPLLAESTSLSPSLLLTIQAFSSSQIQQLTIFPKIWVSLIKNLFQLMEETIRWTTVQSLSNVLKEIQWFYFYGLFCSPPHTTLPTVTLNLLTWNEFIDLQLLIFQFSGLVSRVRCHNDGPDGEFVSFSSQHQHQHQQNHQKSRKRSQGDLTNGDY